MPRFVRGAMVVPGVLIFVFVLAMMPVILQAGTHESSLSFNWSKGIDSLVQYWIGIGSGETFQYFSGKTEHQFWEQIGGYFSTSFTYIAPGAVIGTTLGILIGIWFAYSRTEWWKRIVEIIGILPDFVVIVLLQFLMILIAKKTGVVVFKIANAYSNDPPAVVLPLISMVIIPAQYLLSNVAMQMRLTLSEDYIGSAKARGLRKMYITFFHALPNVIPYIKADLHKLIGILMGNLFIVEYLFNINGVTKLLFSDAFAYAGYQYNLVVNGLLTLLVLYALIYMLLRTFLYAWEKVFLR